MRMYKPLIISKAWDRVWKDREKIKVKEKHEVFDMEFWHITLDINTDTDIGKKIKKGMKIEQATEEVVGKFELEGTTTVIYSDGSRKENSMSTGCSYYIPEEEMEYTLSIDKRCSNFTAEAVAILKALQLMKNRRIKNNIIIYTDALSVIQAVRNNKIGAYVNSYILEIRKKYFDLMKKEYRKNKRIIICWVPAHIGIKGNEIADELAKEATMEEKTREIEVPMEDLKCLYKEEMRTNTIKMIKTLGRVKGTEYFNSYYKEERSKPWFVELNEKRKFITWINRMRANHYNLNISLARVGYLTSARCSCGYEEKDINHFVFTCRKYDNIRIETITSLDSLREYLR